MNTSLNLLLVEDDLDDVVLFRRACPAYYRVEHVPSAAAALHALRGGGFDVCFTDYRLGLETGLELVREARAAALRLPIVVITGQDIEQLGENALLAGATDFVRKDELKPELLQRVVRWAQIRRLVEARRENALAMERSAVSRALERVGGGEMSRTPSGPFALSPLF